MVIAGLGMTIDTIWYVLVAMVLSNSSILTRIQNNQRNLNLITGLLMIGLAIWTLSDCLPNEPSTLLM